MSSSLDRVERELTNLDYTTERINTPQGPGVAFTYTIEAGSHKGQLVTIGLTFQEEGYPEYPPHWIHVSPALPDGRGGSVQEYSDERGRHWLAMSRPPQASWDRLLTKNMQGYIAEHLRGIWADV